MLRAFLIPRVEPRTTSVFNQHLLRIIQTYQRIRDCIEFFILQNFLITLKSDLEIETEAYQENEVIELRGLKKHALNEVRFLLDLEGSCR